MIQMKNKSQNVKKHPGKNIHLIIVSMAIANLSGTNDILLNDVVLLRFPSINVFGAYRVLRNEMVANQTPVQFFDFSQYISEVDIGTT